MNKILLILFLFTFNGYFSQDTVKVMQYNLLNYGNYTSYCSTSNNAIATKNANLKIIIDNTLPDIFTVNEMGAQNNTAIDLMNNCLNVNGRSWYSKAGFTNNQGSNIVNMLYYDNRKFTLKWQEVIANTLRDINVYHLYYNSPDVTNLQDTAYLSCIVAHLKAGSTTSDEDYRLQMAQAIMQYVEDNGKEFNYLLMGDFNVYTSSESAMQEFVNYPTLIYRFNDPINKLGNWNNNSYYSNCHTQSTHTDIGCAASGGMDDRFDFILMSDYIKNGTTKIKYKTNSYIAYGQDGAHFNQAINSPSNASVSTTVADALYNMSDHLPIIMQLEIAQTPALKINDLQNQEFKLSFQNPAYNELNLLIESKSEQQISLIVYSLTAQILRKETLVIKSGANQSKININNLSKGIYLLVITDKDGHTLQRKFNKF